MRYWPVVVALGACGFRTAGAPEDATPPGAPLDAATTALPDARVAPFCDPDDVHLVACYELEGDTRDGSSHHLDATMSNVSFVPGKVGMAMQFGDTSAADVAESPAFDVRELTIEAWIRPSQLPENGNRAGIVDNNGQYGFFLHAKGDLKCSLSAGPVLPQVAANIAADRWTHVACTLRGNTGAIYVDGKQLVSVTGGAAPLTTGTSGISIAADNPPGSGSRLIGLIDQLRMLDVGRTAEQICADAGRASCP